MKSYLRTVALSLSKRVELAADTISDLDEATDLMFLGAKAKERAELAAAAARRLKKSRDRRKRINTKETTE